MCESLVLIRQDKNDMYWLVISNVLFNAEDNPGDFGAGLSTQVRDVCIDGSYLE